MIWYNNYALRRCPSTLFLESSEMGRKLNTEMPFHHAFVRKQKKWGVNEYGDALPHYFLKIVKRGEKDAYIKIGIFFCV